MKNWLITLPVILFMTGCGSDGDSTTPDSGSNPISNVDTGVIPDTGQTTCYYDATSGDGYNPTEFACAPGGWGPDGQDGNHTINTMSFTDSGDGTIKDNVTGLSWQKCSLGKSGSDCSGGSIASHAWSDAGSQCANLNLEGTGWRLPTVTELTRLVNFGTSYSTIDATKFPGTGASAYWTSTVHSTQAWAWYVSFAQGNTWAINQTDTNYVRCVR